ncbi:Uncharacterised protein [Legionella sainthelensi]|uniref:hypothetical protein n=1 Tax=Legionella sainthelensi TaxID=28087 RepID=UPI000F6BC2E0|nr:hypothetical protein [Legionella sainthelensi]VEB36736.1 Uncharacterised protein [Legionella sainthelensi]
MTGMNKLLDNQNDSQYILDRKFKYIFRGYNELEFPFPEIAPTFADMQEAISQQLENIEKTLKNLSQDNKHHMFYKSVLTESHDKFLQIQKRMMELAQGVEVNKQSEVDSPVQRVTIKFPYGACIRLCAEYSELCDYYYRSNERFNKFGPSSLYFQEASLNTQPLNEKDYLKVLEQQDYITAFHEVLAKATDKDKELLIQAKANNYSFQERTPLIKEIYKEMSLPFLFQSVRYKHHLEEDLLPLDIILFPTMKPLSIENFSEFRPYNFYPLGIVPDKIFADEFHLTASDFFYHDVKHSLDMVSRNWTVYLEHDFSFTEAKRHFIQTKKTLDDCIQEELNNIQLDEKQTRDLRHAIKAILFEIYHEEGYAYDYNSMIRALEEPNPFYGEHLVEFLKQKLNEIYFFFPKNSVPDEELNFPIERLDEAKKLLLASLYKAQEIASSKGYEVPEFRWGIARGKTQINPYQKLKNEDEYKTVPKNIGNICLTKESTPQLKSKFFEMKDRLTASSKTENVDIVSTSYKKNH